MHVVADEDIDRVRGIRRADRKLERPAAAGGARQPKEKFLDGKMARIHRLLADISAQLERWPEAELYRDGEPDANRCAVSKPKLQTAHLALTDFEPSAEI
ncbi:MAG TPA: hypothetical protein VGQ64_02085 [Candidatus Limnocylindrales bacterium]|nr:hypothetical protein [Candidatus Limnocylindrales bacterium]